MFFVGSEVGGRAQRIDELLGELDLFHVCFVVLPCDIHEHYLTCVLVLADVELLAEEVRVLDLDQRLDVFVAQVDQVDRVLVASHDVGQLGEVFGEEWLQVSSVRVVARIFDLLRFILGVTVHDKNTALVPNAAQKGTARQQANLCHILAREDLVVA